MNAKQPRTPCLACSKDPARPSYRFCSNQCQRDWDFIGKRVAFLKGEDVGAGFAKRILVYLYGEKCSCCGWAKRNPITNNVPVELEHKDGNHKNNCIGNVCLLCPNCHSLTPTFRALNRGNGREFRRKASVAQLEQQRTCNAPFVSSTLTASSRIFDHLPEGSH